MSSLLRRLGGHSTLHWHSLFRGSDVSVQFPGMPHGLYPKVLALFRWSMVLMPSFFFLASKTRARLSFFEFEIRREFLLEVYHCWFWPCLVTSGIIFAVHRVIVSFCTQQLRVQIYWGPVWILQCS